MPVLLNAAASDGYSTGVPVVSAKPWSGPLAAGPAVQLLIYTSWKSAEPSA